MGTMTKGRPEDILEMGVGSIIQEARYRSRIETLSQLAMLARAGIPVTADVLDEWIDAAKEEHDVR